MDQIFKALGSELRLRLLRELVASPGLKHKDLTARLGVAGGTITKALDPLEDVGLVERWRGGYAVTSPEGLEQVFAAATRLRGQTTPTPPHRAPGAAEPPREDAAALGE
jgi:DNA-binding transcriptional ArsR family regulator